MSVYRVVYRPRAARQIEKLPRDVQDQLRPAIAALATDPRPHNCKKLVGPGGFWRIRVGQYRVIYLIEDRIRVVTISEAVNRRDAY